MAGEKYTKATISDVSRRDMLSQDPYYGLSNSFQYSENINCDDELHGIKLSQKILELDDCANCQLISAGNIIFALPLDGGSIQKITYSGGTWSVGEVSGASVPKSSKPAGAIFQDYLWATVQVKNTTALYRTPVDASWWTEAYLPYDHTEDTDESIASETTTKWTMNSWAGVILNYNNTRLVVWVLNELRVYYPELDKTNPNSPYYDATATKWKSWRKKVQDFEWGSMIVGLTCDFQYLKVRVQDEWWNTKIFYYQGNNDLRNTFVYDLVDLTGTKVLHTYSINGTDYYTASLDGTVGYITLNKVIGKTAVQIFKQRGWLTSYDINQKSWYFVGPTSIDAGYIDGNFYIADSYGVFKFAYNPQGYDTGYLKRKIRSTNQNTPWLCIYKNFVVVSDQDGVKMMRTYDTGVDGYESRGILISREMEWDYGWCIAKMLDEVRCHYELNNIDDAEDNPWEIDIYVSPNNLWRNADPEADSTGRYKVMHIDEKSINTRFEITNPLNNLEWTPAFEFDWQTITYCVVISRGTSSAEWTPIVREIQLMYTLKGKTNNIYNIN